MKKITGFFGVAVIAAAMFMNTSNANKTGDINLASIIGLASANAEDCYDAWVMCDNAYPDDYALFSACYFGAGC